MRLFGLRKSNEILWLNGETGLYFMNPQGLGYSLGPTFADNNYGFFTNVYSKAEPQQQITGDIYYVNDPYNSYKEFVDWLNSGDAIDFVYRPDAQTYYRRVEVASISKSEINQYSVLQTQITFNALTPWYLETISAITFGPDRAQSGIIRYTYGYSYRYLNTAVERSFELTSEGHMDSGIIFTINGPCTIPSITLVSSGKTLGKVELHGVGIVAGKQFVYSSVPGDSYISANNDDISNLADITENIFFRVPRNSTATMTVKLSTQNDISAELKVINYFRGV